MRVEMPQLGETVTEGTILRWAKQVGESVAEDEVLVEISTDKVDTEVPSPVAGVVTEILVPEGETVSVGSVICVIGDAGAEPAAAPVAEAAAVPEASPPVEPEPAPAPTPTPTPTPEPAPAPAAAPAPEPAPTPEAAPSSTRVGTRVEMPQLGETVTEGTILRWAKQVGESVAEDEVLVEISTDKVDTEVPSPVAGVVTEILVPEGETVSVGSVICVIGDAGAEPAAAPVAEAAAVPEASPPVEPEPAPAPTPTPTPEPAPAPAAAPAATAAPSGRTDAAGRLLSPVVRKLIREHAVDVSQIAGTGEGGRVTRKDVEAFIASGPPPAPAEPVPAAPAPAPEPVPAAPAPAPAPPAPDAAPAAPAEPLPEGVIAGPEDEVADLSRIRVRIGENMIKSKQTAAHVFTSVEVDYERLERVRQRHKAAFKAKEGFSLTYLPFIARATVDALHEFPLVNSSYYLEQKKAVFHKSVHMGIAIDMNQEGLVVATIRQAESLRLVALARQIRGLAEKARDGKLGPDDVVGSTFTITNAGPFGSYLSAPIINVPNTGILSTDAVSKRPTVIQGADGEDVIAIRHIGILGLSWDHRAFDGVTAVSFLQRIKKNIETWDWEQELA